MVRLTFGNAVGRVPAGPLGTLVVQSAKWTEDDYDRMLTEVSEEAQALPFAATSSSMLPYQRDPDLRIDLPYHAFMWLAHALLDAPRRPLAAALRGLVADPHRRLVRVEREVPVELARAVGTKTIDDILAMRWPLQRVARGLGVGGLLPVRVADAHAHSSVDTAENRFVKAFLETCRGVVGRVRSGLETLDGGVAARIRARLDAVEAALAPIVRATMWREVGSLTHVASGSSVMQRDARYREVLRASALLRGCVRALPLSDREVVQLLEVKDVALMYEIWCGSALSRLLRELLGPPIDVKPVHHGDFHARVRWGLRARWTGGVRLAFNARYSRSAGWFGRSSSLPHRPDFVLRIRSGPAAGLHVFDAKFKHDGDDDPSVARADILKMHAYRDAIPEVRSAWVLFPGTRAVRYPDEGTVESLGVGAFPVLPGKEPTDLRLQLRALVLGQPT
ncbi:MAG: DUF2357 domain-containing protein [Deltaproteobacteria bacterium]|nr:DUF2357 domain-containing protein [Deltaproteobacteria bacterium]